MPLVPMMRPPSVTAPDIRINISAMTIFSENGGKHRPFVIVAVHIGPGGVPTTAASCRTTEHGGHAWSRDPEATI